MRARSGPVASGPFDCFFTPADPLVFLNYAIPREPAGADAAAAAALERCGDSSEPASFAMSCARGALRMPAVDAAFELALHDDTVSDAEIRATLRVRDDAFGMPHDEPGKDANRLGFRPATYAVLAYIRNPA